MERFLEDLSASVLGAASWNRMIHVERLPQGVSATIFDAQETEGAGSTGVGKSMVLAALGCPTTFHCALGRDEYAALIKAACEKRGIGMIVDDQDAPTPRHVNIMDRQGGRYSIFLSNGPVDPAIDEARLGQLAGMFWQGKAGAMVAGYKANHPGYSPGDLMVRMWSDAMRMGQIELAEAQVRAGTAPVWMYLFEWESPVLPYLKSAHGIDGSFYFDNTEVLPITQGNPTAARLAQKTSKAWTNFAKAGKPAAPGLPKWPAYTLDKRETMILANTSRIERDPMGADRELRVKLGVMS